tara:strand:+ start:51 stop:764 length:714 start_codon:yes stop_codon:yes gene_type:complete
MIKGNSQLRKYTTIYPKTVYTINSLEDYNTYGYKLLKQSNNKKLGKVVGRGKFVKKPLYSLSLCEREMGCPKSCHHWDSCYGNNMPFAHRFKTNNTLHFTAILKDEIYYLTKKYKFGIHIRLHVLGDFFDREYVNFWYLILKLYPKVSIYGYTAHKPTSELGKRLNHVISKIGFERFAIRFSNADVELSANSTEYKPKKNVSFRPIVCLEQENKVANCVSCGVCWNSKAKQILFKTH